MATQMEYTFVANTLVALAHQYIVQLPSWEAGLIPQDKIPAAAGAAAKAAVDALDQYRAAHPPAPAAGTVLKRRRRK